MGNKTITPRQLKALKKKISYEMMVLFVACCMDEFGWTDEDVMDFSVRWNRYYDAVDTHTLSIKKVAEIVTNITGMKFEK